MVVDASLSRFGVCISSLPPRQPVQSLRSSTVINNTSGAFSPSDICLHPPWIRVNAHVEIVSNSTSLNASFVTVYSRLIFTGFHVLFIRYRSLRSDGIRKPLRGLLSSQNTLTFEISDGCSKSYRIQCHWLRSRPH